MRTIIVSPLKKPRLASHSFVLQSSLSLKDCTATQGRLCICVHAMWWPSSVGDCDAGNMYELGADSGRNYSVNVPLKEGMDDQSKWHFYETHTHMN